MSNEFALEANLDHIVFDTIEACDAVSDLACLDRLFAPACARLGFSHIATFSVREASGRMAGHYQSGTTNRAWEDHYIEQRHFIHDAIVAQLPQTLEPIVWSRVAKSQPLSDVAKAIFEEARAFGIADGYVLPQHYLDGAIVATILLAPDAPDHSTRARAAAQILSAYFAAGVRKLTIAPAPCDVVSLSKRQRECLQWVRAGKSDWEIGEILGISEHTVREHIEAARQKLGVRTRTQAVIEAIQRKLISI